MNTDLKSNLIFYILVLSWFRYWFLYYFSKDLISILIYKNLKLTRYWFWFLFYSTIFLLTRLLSWTDFGKHFHQCLLYHLYPDTWKKNTPWLVKYHAILSFVIFDSIFKLNNLSYTISFVDVRCVTRQQYLYICIII